MEYLILYRCPQGHVPLFSEHNFSWCEQCCYWYRFALMQKEEVRFSIKSGDRAWAALWR